MNGTDATSINAVLSLNKFELLKAISPPEINNGKHIMIAYSNPNVFVSGKN